MDQITASKKIAWVVLMCMVLISASPSVEALTCGQVSGALAPCVGYLTKNAALGNCCAGVRSLVSQAKTPADRKAVCICLKTLAKRFPGIIPANAAALPGKCGVKIPYSISPSTDCSKVT